MGVRIEGIEEMRRSLDMSVREMENITVKAMRSASRSVTKEVKSRLTDENFRFLVKSKVKKGQKTKSGYPTAVIGMFKPPYAKRGESSNNENRLNWYKAYWKNYGTLQRRSSSHHFVKPIKVKSRGKTGGITPRGFFEQALNSVGWESKIRGAFAKNFKKQMDKYNKSGV